ncbi:MAG: response regulator transcription factor [Bradyrhizobium sp.]|nr:response regulator transcription factor [Bradyrhizobium sp.]MBV9727623.1 response regulator transcription factor [Gammaproteobacteria bacterium]
MIDEASTIFVVDDDEAVLKGLDRLLRTAGFGTELFASAHSFLDAYPQHDATGCIILDLAMPGLGGLQVQERLLEAAATLPIIFLTGHGDIHSGVQAMKLGASDFLTKPVDDEVLLNAVRQAIRRCTHLRRARRETADIDQRLATLTPREHEVLRHLLSGKLNKQIAASLGTVEKTIKVHRARVLRKMQAPTLAVLVRLAERAGIAAEVSRPSQSRDPPP